VGRGLYQWQGLFGEAQDACDLYGLPNIQDFGKASGGFPPEGMLYGESMGWLFETFLELQTAGITDPAVWGAQIGLLCAPITDRHVLAYLCQPEAMWTIPFGTAHQYRYFGPGDILAGFVQQDECTYLNTLLMLREKQGRTQYSDVLRWSAVNMPVQGPNDFYPRLVKGTMGTGAGVSSFLTLAPETQEAAFNSAVDPRWTQFPKFFHDGKLGRLIARRAWAAESPTFIYGAAWNEIGHQHADGGLFVFNRFNPVTKVLEKLTGAITGYPQRADGCLSLCHNTLSIQNRREAGAPTKSSDPAFQMVLAYETGSQYWNGHSAGFPSSIVSQTDEYVYANSDLTNLYNWTFQANLGPDYVATKVGKVNRSILWLAARDLIVTYDRVHHLEPGLFRRWQCCTEQMPTISGSSAIALSKGGQILKVECLAPAGTLTAFDYTKQAASLGGGENMRCILQFTDSTAGLVSNFLTVIRGADPGATLPDAGYVKSSDGAIEGGVIGDTAILFGDTLHETFDFLPAAVKLVYFCDAVGVTKQDVTVVQIPNTALPALMTPNVPAEFQYDGKDYVATITEQ